MTPACHHAPRETGTACQPRCVHCGVMIGQARCETCNGAGRLSGIEEKCPTCSGWRAVWREVTTFVPTPGNRSDGET
jgi:DnaJ-class molecular chaperone